MAASAGNHGAAVAYASQRPRRPGRRSFVPRTAPEAKREKIARWGAELVVVASDNYDDAEALAKELAADRGRRVPLAVRRRRRDPRQRRVARLRDRAGARRRPGARPRAVRRRRARDRARVGDAGGVRRRRERAQRLGRAERGVVRDGHVARARRGRRAPRDGRVDAGRGARGRHLGRRLRPRARRPWRASSSSARSGSRQRWCTPTATGARPRGERRDGARRRCSTACPARCAAAISWSCSPGATSTPSASTRLALPAWPRDKGRAAMPLAAVRPRDRRRLRLGKEHHRALDPRGAARAARACSSSRTTTTARSRHLPLERARARQLRPPRRARARSPRAHLDALRTGAVDRPPHLRLRHPRPRATRACASSRRRSSSSRASSSSPTSGCARAST